MAKGVKTGGRVKGTPNKIGKALRDMILEALDGQKGGGVQYLKMQAVLNPGPFMTLLGKVLPTTIAGDPDAPLKVFKRIERVIVDPMTPAEHREQQERVTTH